MYTMPSRFESVLEILKAIVLSIKPWELWCFLLGTGFVYLGLEYQESLGNILAAILIVNGIRIVLDGEKK